MYICVLCVLYIYILQKEYSKSNSKIKAIYNICNMYLYIPQTYVYIYVCVVCVVYIHKYSRI